MAGNDISKTRAENIAEESREETIKRIDCELASLRDKFSRMTKKRFLWELKKKFGDVGNPIKNNDCNKVQEYYVWVQDTKGSLFAEYPLHFFVENEGTSDERVFTPHPNKEKQKEFEEVFKKKIESFSL